MNRKIRIGVIGLGVMGEQYVSFYQKHEWSEVVAIAARRSEQVEAVKAKFGIRHGFTDWQQLLALPEVDAVCVALPDNLHFAASRAAMERGKHVLIEKPMTTDLAEADALVDVARRSAVKAQVAYNHRWLAPYHQGRTLIADGAIGKPLFAYARKNDTIFVPTQMISWAGQTTPAWFLNAHDIDLVCWYFDSDPIEARAWGIKHVLASQGIDTYDMISSQVRFASGALATFECGWIYPNSFPTIVDSFIEVVGEKGHLHFDRKRESIELSTPEKFSYPKNFLSSEIFGVHRGAYPACLEDFLRSIREDRTPVVTIQDGRRSTAVLAAIHQSLESGQSVSIPLPASVQG